MAPVKLVLDTNVFLEVLFERELKQQALSLIEQATEEKAVILEPPLVFDEITEIVAVNSDETEKIERDLERIDGLIQKAIVNVVLPSVAVRMKAVEIFKTGHPKSGYPSYSDAICHALAMQMNATFVTNDKPHFNKAKQFGNIALLKEFIPLNKVFYSTRRWGGES